jgi:DNA-binding NarL/FixJ family response regulator
MHDEALYAQRALDAGAEGYLAKQEPTGRLLMAIRRILDGRTYFSEEINEQMLLRYLDHSSGAGASLLQSLSDRELQVFKHMGQGLTTREIADVLHLSPKTIGTYRSRIKDKLTIESNAELRRRAVIWVELVEA